MKIVTNKTQKSFVKADEFLMIAGPCSIISYERTKAIATFLIENGVKYLRGGAYKPRTSPYDYQGLGEEGLEILRRVKEETGIKIVTEIIDKADIQKFSFVDIIQVGARNMQNFSLLKALGKQNKPVLLKRGFGNTYEELLQAAEYIALGGNTKIILCERGIRSFSNSSRFLLDFSTIIRLKKNTILTVIADPSHAAGSRELVAPLAEAASMVADGLIIEVETDPESALSDQNETLSLSEFKNLLLRIKKLQKICEKKLV